MGVTEEVDDNRLKQPVDLVRDALTLTRTDRINFLMFVVVAMHVTTMITYSAVLATCAIEGYPLTLPVLFLVFPAFYHQSTDMQNSRATILTTISNLLQIRVLFECAKYEALRRRGNEYHCNYECNVHAELVQHKSNCKLSRTFV